MSTCQRAKPAPMVIDGTTYVPEAVPADIKIVVLQRGWVAVGRVTRSGDDIHITGGHIVRRWGTTKGIGELAGSGPLAETKLDPASTIRVHHLAVICMFDCEDSKWLQHIN